jgi:hypothetical protein
MAVAEALLWAALVWAVTAPDRQLYLLAAWALLYDARHILHRAMGYTRVLGPPGRRVAAATRFDGLVAVGFSIAVAVCHGWPHPALIIGTAIVGLVAVTFSSGDLAGRAGDAGLESGTDRLRRTRFVQAIERHTQLFTPQVLASVSSR